MLSNYGSQSDVIVQTCKRDKLPDIFFISSPGLGIGDVHQLRMEAP